MTKQSKSPKKNKTPPPPIHKGNRKKASMNGRAPIDQDERKFLQKAKRHMRRFELTTALIQLIRLEYKDMKESCSTLTPSCSSRYQRYQEMKRIFKDCLAQYEDKKVQPPPTEFIDYTCQLDLLYFFKQVEKQFTILTWNECIFTLLMNLEFNKFLVPTFQSFIEDCAPRHLRKLEIYSKDEETGEMDLEMDYGSQSFTSEEIKQEMQKVVFHLIIETLRHTSIKIRQ